MTDPTAAVPSERVDRARELGLLARLEGDIAQVDTAMGLVESGDLDAASEMVGHLSPALDAPASPASTDTDAHPVSGSPETATAEPA